MKTVEVKIYLTEAQKDILSKWMRICCGIYNRALEQRIKAYQRRKESINYYDQQLLLTSQRKTIKGLSEVPAQFSRDALRRVDRGMKAFFRRCKSGEKPGFPRFRSAHRYLSMEYLDNGQYVRGNNLLSIPKLGLVKYRGGKQRISKTQKLLRIIRRANGWYAQVLVDEAIEPKPMLDKGPIGIDMGLNTFAAMSNGSCIENPRFARKSEHKRRGLQRRVSRQTKGSNRRHKAVMALRRHHERITMQRRNFCHENSTRIVRNHPIIAIENLNIKGMSKTKMAKSIMDAGWSIFMNQLAYKAEYAGRNLIRVNARGTSQTCPQCGEIKRKSLSERVHRCPCGCVINRDVAAAQVILVRALGDGRGDSRVEEPASFLPFIAVGKADPLNRVISI